ncbi:MAG: hypothetical protein ACPGVD_09060 [Flavobacteriales bacterium]
MRILLLLLLINFSNTLTSQSAKYVYRNLQDSTHNAYLLVTPDSAKIRGVIIRDFTRLPDTAKKTPYKWKGLALQKGFAVLYTTTATYFPGLCYTDSSTQLLDEIINEAIIENNLPRNNLFIGGLSASGTRALRYTQYCEQGKSKFGIKIKGVFSVDSPLDLERFCYSAKNNKRNFKDGMLWEANLMNKIFPDRLGPIETNTENYRQNSVFSYKDSLGGNAKYLLNVPTLFFHEPDVDWWIKERGAAYYDINSFDIAGLVNWLTVNGGTKVEQVITTNKGFDRQGNRKCHSWTIVDEEYLIDWIVKQSEN